MKNILFTLMLFLSFNMLAQNNNMMIRISEIEIDSIYLKEYNNILQKESKASVQKEPGVIAIFPMYQKENPTQVRILEIYANKTAYEDHIKSPHFQEYKTSTLKMVKSLKLIDMKSIDPETMAELFRKLNQ
jgi:quinol monooxygenase YgiN